MSLITRTYKTNEVAKITGIHPNTVRMYEDIGFITKPLRRDNGYRVFTALHINQIQLARLAMRGEILQNGLRKKVINIIKLCAQCKFEQAIADTIVYDAMLSNEINNAKAAVFTVEDILNKKPSDCQNCLKRQETADLLDITIDTLRNWELNGLLKVKRKSNGYRVYDDSDINRLKIIRMLRCANYSLSSILRMLNKLSNDSSVSVEETLNTPDESEEIISVCDRLLVSLKQTQSDAAEILLLLQKIKNQNPPL